MHDPPRSEPVAATRLQRADGRARISLRMRDGATRLAGLYQEGCAKVRWPSPLPGAAPEAVLINTAGGLTGGDRLDVAVELGAGASATVTTQACERIYRSTGDVARVALSASLGAGARLSWLPQETILFDGGRLSRSLTVDLAEGAEFLGVEAVLFGRVAMGERVVSGALHDRWRIRRSGRLIFADDLRFAGPIADSLARPAILGGGVALATVVFAGADPERRLEPVRELIGGEGGASAWDGKLVARICARDGLGLRRRVERILICLLGGRTLPKVWQL